MDFERIVDILDSAQTDGRSFLLETEGLALLAAIGIATPVHRFLSAGSEGPAVQGGSVPGLERAISGVESLDLEIFRGDRVVLKVVSADIQHKSELGGVAVVERSRPALRDAVREMAQTVSERAPEAQIHGFLVEECVAFEKSLGHELILGVRWNEDVGPVAVFGAGGIHTEFLARSFREGKDVAVISPYLGDCAPRCAAGRSSDREPVDHGVEEAVGDVEEAVGDVEEAVGAVEGAVEAVEEAVEAVGDVDANDSPDGRASIGLALDDVAITPLLTAGLRGQPPVLSRDALIETVERFLLLGREFLPERIAEIEVNPLVVSLPLPTPSSAAGLPAVSAVGPPAVPAAGLPAVSAAKTRDGAVPNRLVALDVVVRLGQPARARAPERPLAKIDQLLHPKSIALAGVSETQKNPGRVILDNLLAGGFDPAHVHVIKADCTEIAGVRCVPSPGALPVRVDMAVLSVAAATLPEMVIEFIEAERAESLIIIPGGLEEKQGSEAIVQRMHSALHASRRTNWGGPVINGGNCLGIQSRPGNYDTLFIPRYKLPVPQGEAAPVALLCQSGAHMVANLGRLGGVVPRYSISAGNQTDLTVGDYLTYLADDPAIQVYACYVEGFRPLDGLAFFRAAEKIVKSGRTVLLYLAGRTPSGAMASASHTASLAGDYPVLRAIAKQAGIVLAKNLANFADLLQLFALLGDTQVSGTRLGAISNAGFECVGIADSIRSFQLSNFSSSTRDRLRRVLESARIATIVDVHNPLDLTPMSGDAVYAEAIAAVMEDDDVDVGVFGIVPLTPALQTLEPGPEHREDLGREGGIAERMAALRARLGKPWVAVVDGGGRYDAFARELRGRGIPTFRTADRAVKLFEAYVGEALRRKGVQR